MDLSDEIELRGDRKSKIIERSKSYSEAMKNSKVDDEIINLIDSKVYTNDDVKGKYRISQTFVEGKEISFPMQGEAITIDETDSNDEALNEVFKDCAEYLSQSEDTDEENVNNGLVMKIDVDKHDIITNNGTFPSPTTSSTLPSGQTFRRMLDDSDLNTIEVDGSTYNNTTTGTIPDTSTEYGHSFPLRSRSRTNKHSSKHGKHGGARRQRSRRVVKKDGEENVPLRQHIPRKSIKYMRDAVNTVINSKWRFIICLIIVSHFLFWLFFAMIWYTVTLSYQDDFGDGKEHCVTGTSSFAGMMMMAVETQMTIGYGVRYPNEECPEAILIMVLEIIAGTALSGGLSSLLFVKLVRPQKHISSVGFSKKAAVCLRDGELCLMFRVWDLMSLHTVNSSITAYLLKPIRTLEGEHHQNYIHQLELKDAKAFLLWPITVVHVIDEKSPLYTLSAQNMMNYRFEIVVCLAGASQSMGTTTQSKTSYLSKEIIWGYRFKNVIKYSKKEECYVIDTENLNTVEQVETPLCSAYQLREVQEDIKCSRNMLSLSPTDNSLSPEFNATIFSEDSSLISKIDISPSQSFSELSTRSPGPYKIDYAPEINFDPSLRNEALSAEAFKREFVPQINFAPTNLTAEGLSVPGSVEPQINFELSSQDNRNFLRQFQK